MLEADIEPRAFYLCNSGYLRPLSMCRYLCLSKALRAPSHHKLFRSTAGGRLEIEYEVRTLPPSPCLLLLVWKRSSGGGAVCRPRVLPTG
jgi:hypothetical protein